jgi:hypothetical protein
MSVYLKDHSLPHLLQTNMEKYNLKSSLICRAEIFSVTGVVTLVMKIWLDQIQAILIINISLIHIYGQI